MVYASPFMAATSLYAGTWVLSCAFLMWAPRTNTCISIFTLRTRYFVVWLDVTLSFKALHFVRCILGERFIPSSIIIFPIMLAEPCGSPCFNIILGMGADVEDGLMGCQS